MTPSYNIAITQIIIISGLCIATYSQQPPERVILSHVMLHVLGLLNFLSHNLLLISA